MITKGLSLYQTPYWDRIKARGGGGARVATLDQIEGVKVSYKFLGGEGQEERGGGGAYDDD